MIQLDSNSIKVKHRNITTVTVEQWITGSQTFLYDEVEPNTLTPSIYTQSLFLQYWQLHLAGMVMMSLPETPGCDSRKLV